MPGWTPLCDWMSFRHLDDGRGLDGAFVLSYKITDDGAERWSARYNRFKGKDRAALIGAAAVLKVAVPELLVELGLVPAETVFIPALPSRETRAVEGGFLTLLAKRLAEVAGAGFDMNSVEKSVHRPVHDLYSAADRTAELDKANYSARRMRGFGAAIVVDDFITRGGTLSRIANAIKATNAGMKVYGVALGKTERRSYWGTLTNDHVPERWNRLWESGERRYRERMAGDPGE